MKHFIFLFFLTLYFSFGSFAQDSTMNLHRGQLLKYRKGYLITVSNDTLQGLIWIEGDGALCFIREGIKIKTPIAGNTTKIPFITAGDGYVKAFYRNGIFYEVCNIPPYNNAVFLEPLERGALTLYVLINGYEDARKADSQMGGLLENEANKTLYTTEEYYRVKAYYVLKRPGNEPVLIPNGDKPFREAFYPLVKDNPAFLRGLAGQAFDYYHLRDLVKQYNSK